uniref:Uncharacterized protein n=1 Tax=Anguilla anguilla TaxID=7936 RepID=A0A0E9VAC6_ANGAN
MYATGQCCKPLSALFILKLFVQVHSYFLRIHI